MEEFIRPGRHLDLSSLEDIPEVRILRAASQPV
jgi:hypothetical protein